MTGMKDGAGNLEFGEKDTQDADVDGTDEADGAESAKGEQSDAGASEEAEMSAADDTAHSRRDGRTEQVSSGGEVGSESAQNSVSKYPYFIRRSNVGDERDTRLEIHVRDKVADQEASFRNELAAELGTSEVSKTDAREFALLAAYRHPEQVAELMMNEGFGELD